MNCFFDSRSESVNAFDPTEFPSLGSRVAAAPGSALAATSSYGEMRRHRFGATKNSYRKKDLL